MEVVTLPSGVSMKVLGTQAYDWSSIRILAEKGVPYSVIAKHFNGLDKVLIAKQAHYENWMTPVRESKMRRELLGKQRDSLIKTGDARDPDQVMAEIWQERQKHLDQKAWSIVESALDGVTEETSRDMIVEAKDLKTMVEVGRKVTGKEAEEAKDRDQGPQMAINVGFLRSAGIEQPTIDV